MPEARTEPLTIPDEIRGASTAKAQPRPAARKDSARALIQTLGRQWKLFWGIEAALLLLCLIYCLVAPNQYEAVARVELRTSPASPLNLEPEGPRVSASVVSAQIALETAAGVLRGDDLAWRVIRELKLYQAKGFAGGFARRFPGFRADAPSPEAEGWLLKRFARRLHVETMPRTLLIEIRFRSHDGALSAAVVNALVAAYQQQEADAEAQSTAQAADALSGRLRELDGRVDRDQRKLAAFDSEHAIVMMPQATTNGAAGETEHDAAAQEIDDLSQQLAAASSQRILAEAEYRAAQQGDPESVVAADPRLQGASAGFATAALDQIQAKRSDLEQEKAQLSVEHGPNFPRVVEIGRQLTDLDRQKRVEDAKLVERFRGNWQTALDREQLARKLLAAATAEGLKASQAAGQDVMLRDQLNADHSLYLNVESQVEQAALAEAVPSSNLRVVDRARQPANPSAPNLPLYMAVTFFVGLWIAAGGVLMSEWRAGSRIAMLLFAPLLFAAAGRAQAPTPSTSGLPTGVATFPQTPDQRSQPNPREAPTVWTGTGTPQSAPAEGAVTPQVSMPAPIAAGDTLEISEAHTPEFRSIVQVSAAGTVTLPLIGDIKIAGLDERGAAKAIDAALVKKGMLLHPIVSVLVTGYAGQDVSVLGEVARPGVYPYTYHHRLLDLISAAQGLKPNAGRLVNIFHASDPTTPHPVILDPSGTDHHSNHNPELEPGDTVQVSRAGLVYVVGDVIRPGGFPVDPVQGLTVVQALSLAWGPSRNADTAHAVLIREQKGGRTITRLNLKRMMRGQDPDQPVEDRDILYVPDSVRKDLWNRTLESVIQSTFGVSIYSALVYSQRY